MQKHTSDHQAVNDAEGRYAGLTPDAAIGNTAAPTGVEAPAQIQMPIALADYSQEQVDELSHGQIADRLRGYDHPLLKSAADSIDYLAAQEGLLELAQQAAEKARADLAEHKRPLDQPMARLNARVTALNEKNAKLRAVAQLYIDTIESVENRCMAADGPVTPTHKEITDDELRKVYEAAKTALEIA